MPESFGARLRQRREQQQIGLASIAEQTKIKLSLLEALEHDDVSHWPTGIFRRAFIRAYAHAIGLEPDVVVREFLELYPDPIEVVSMASAIQPSVGPGPVDARPPTRLRYVAQSASDYLSRQWLRLTNRRTPVLDVPAAGDVPAVDDVPAADDALADSDVPRVDDVPLVDNIAPVRLLPQPALDLSAAAQLCTEIGRLCEPSEAAPLLQRAARILDAVGLIVWLWDPQSGQLRPVLAHGYSDKVLAQLPQVSCDADNATAAAFRSAQTCVVKGSDRDSGAVVVPLMTPGGCAGVLAVELPPAREPSESVRALATIFAAQLATLAGAARLADAVNA
jgi:hypothetical protein